MADYILTFSKTRFYPLEPVVDDIKIEDIAHALSLMTRANGHFKHFYSVAQHSINCYKEAKERGYSKSVQLGCLLHDASEAYISDITRPVKRSLSQYWPIEEKLQRVIYMRYGLALDEREHQQIKEIDDAVLYYEFIALMGEKIFEEVPEILVDHDFTLRDFSSVENEFKSIFKGLTTSKTGKSFVGIDGCKDGWVVVEISETSFEIGIFKQIDEICFKYSNSDSLIIDMPIGLPESEADLRPDGQARGFLSSRASCIFNSPCRQAVYSEDYYLANSVNKSILGKGLSKQSYMITPKIKEIDIFLGRSPEFKNKLVESHPEICFAMLNSVGRVKEPIFENKKTEEGVSKRLSLLSRYYKGVDEVARFMFDDPKLCTMIDDVIDALCLAVTGMIGYIHGFKTIPEQPMYDCKGLLMQMVFVDGCLAK